MSQNSTFFSCLFGGWVIPRTYTGGPRDHNTRQCCKTTQQTFPVYFLHGLYLTSTREDPTTVTPASVAKQHNKPFLCTFCMGYTSQVHRNTRQCRKTTQPTFPVSFLHGFYSACTWEDPTTVTPARKQHNKPFLCTFCMGYTSHVHRRTPRP